jgi:hypothetical protein
VRAHGRLRHSDPHPNLEDMKLEQQRMQAQCWNGVRLLFGGTLAELGAGWLRPIAAARGEVLVSTAPDARSARATSGDFPTAVKPTKLIHVARLRRLASWLRRSLLPQDTSSTSS